MYAQELTLEYHFGYGLFKMSDMKDALANASTNTNLTGVKTTDKFPGNFTHNIRAGVQLKRHQIGLTYAFLNTSGQNHLADYSGEYRLRMRNTGNQLGIFYRYHFIEGKFTPFFQLDIGGIFNNCDISEFIRIGNEQQKYDATLTGTNFFLQPAIGVRYKVCPFAALAATVGYEWDPTGNMHLKGEKDAESRYSADWSGLRVSVGIITYFKMK